MEQFKSPAYSHVKEVSLILSHDFICSKVVIFMCFVSHWLNCFSVRLALLVLNILIICVVPIWVVEKTGSLIICLSFNQNISHKVLIFWWSFMFFYLKQIIENTMCIDYVLLMIICLSFNQNISHKVLIFWWSFMFFLPETNHWEYNVYWLFAVNDHMPVI